MAAFALSSRPPRRAAAAAEPVGAVDDDDLLKAGANDANWLMYGRTYDAHRYSPLKQINTKNVARLIPVWTFQTGVLDGFECTPLVIDGIMYVTTPWNHAYAIDCKTGSQLWHYQKSLPENLALCCDAVNRGFAAWGDRLYMATLDAHLVCLDRNTGEEVWDMPITVPGDDGKEVKRHLQDGLQRHRRPAGRQGQGHHRHQRRRVRHPRLHRRLRRQDRQAALAVLHRPQRRRQVRARPEGPGNLGRQLLADRRRLGLGHRHLRSRAQHPLLGHRQSLARLQRRRPQGRQPLHLLDPGPQPRRRHLQVALPEQPPRRLGLRRRQRAACWSTSTRDGKPVKALVQAHRNGYFYCLNRENGEFIYGKPFCEVTWTDRTKGADGLDPKTGRPFVNPAALPTEAGVRVCPGAAGGKEWNPMAYDPGTGFAYVPVINNCAKFTSGKAFFIKGQPYWGSSLTLIDNQASGAFKAIDVTTGKIKWEVATRSPMVAGVLATGGGLVFTGDAEGFFTAYDAETGKVLWTFQCGSGHHSGADHLHARRPAVHRRLRRLGRLDGRLRRRRRSLAPQRPPRQYPVRLRPARGEEVTATAIIGQVEVQDGVSLAHHPADEDVSMTSPAGRAQARSGLA